MNYKYVFNIVGKILLVISFYLMTVIPWIYYFDEKILLHPIIISAFIPLLAGLIIYLLTYRHSKQIRIKEEYLIVLITWLLVGIVGAIPYYVTHAIPSFTDAFFESVSGFTTTGSSILTDIESLPKSILYWRNLTNWIGGMGIIVLVLAIIPKLKLPAYQLFQLESSGIMPDKFKPRTKEIARRLWLIYILLTVINVGLLMLSGVNFFDSLCQAFATIATGGFSTKNASLGYFPIAAQYITMIFMILSGINFTLHYYALKGKFHIIRRNSELKAYLLIILTTGFILTFYLFFNMHTDFEKAFRDSFFQVASIITATGFATADYLQWHTFGWVLIFALMFIGASVGSTGGGIKVIRHVVAFKSIRNYIRRLLHPHAIVKIRINGHAIAEDKAGSVMLFIIIYLIVFVAGTFFMSFLGVDFQTSVGSVITTMGGIGPGIGSVGPAGNFSAIPDTGKILLSMLMIMGRLEILTFLIVFTPSFWKN